ncbi:SAG family member [Eimeria mitis]|uniref:SAG family member n=1 Tax=Eimeria mitis TaxID=44415 RepID=U6K3I5_9EIME|nr:SAG family member [Eimeria mitis]CDJ31541.1 SAG family member [Eimeria mitis]
MGKSDNDTERGSAGPRLQPRVLTHPEGQCTEQEFKKQHDFLERAETNFSNAYLVTMAPLNLLTVVSASFLVLARVNGTVASQQPTYKVAFGNDGKCLAEVNAARLAAGLSALVQAEKANADRRMPDTATDYTGSGDTWAWLPVCKALIPEAEEKKASRGAGTTTFQSGTYAYLPVENPDAVDCNAVVDKWKGAYSNFDGLPPPNKEEDNLYKNHENVSFVALYNPSTDATADCRVVTCTKTTPETASFKAARTSGTKTETGSALICMTAPDVLPKKGEKSPFTEEQWGQIVTAIEGSASAVAPGVVGLALVILGLSML